MLRDAQTTIAAEHGCDSWEHFVSSLGGALSTPRWRTNNRVEARSFTEARQRGDNYVTGDHLLLALLATPQPTIAATILRELGHTQASVLAHLPTYTDGGRTGTTTSTPRE